MSQDPHAEEKQQIAIGKAAREVIDNPAMRIVLQELSDRYYAEFRDPSATSEKLQNAHFKSVVLDELSNALATKSSIGEGAQVTKAQREARENARPSRNR